MLLIEVARKMDEKVALTYNVTGESEITYSNIGFDVQKGSIFLIIYLYQVCHTLLPF